MPKINTVKLFDVDVHNLTMPQTVSFIGEAMENKVQIVHSCLNASLTVLIQDDLLLKECLQKSDIVSADGQAIVWSSMLFGKPLPERVPGPDLMNELIILASTGGYKIYFFGAEQEIVQAVANLYEQEFGKEIIAGFRNGFYKKEEEELIAQEINESGASILFVAIPSPQKEVFIKNHREKMKDVLLLMGVGGSFDVVAGKVKRAPRWMQDNGLEWFYRLVQEPRKLWKRYLIGNFRYIFLTWGEYTSGLKKGQ